MLKDGLGVLGQSVRVEDLGVGVDAEVVRDVVVGADVAAVVVGAMVEFRVEVAGSVERWCSLSYSFSTAGVFNGNNSSVRRFRRVSCGGGGPPIDLLSDAILSLAIFHA